MLLSLTAFQTRKDIHWYICCWWFFRCAFEELW